MSTVLERPTTTGAASRNYSLPAEQAGEALMASLKLNGVDHIWFTSGSEIGWIQEIAIKHQALGRPTPKVMTMTHEQAALAAASAETAITGRPSATASHVECGMINAGGAIHNADRGHYPVLLMSGYPPSAEAGSVPGARNSHIQWCQQIPDQGMILRQYMRWDHKLATYDNAGLVVTRACQIMLSEPQGPAYLAVPREAAMHPIQSATFPLRDALPAAQTAAPDRAALRQAAEWLLEAKNPLICVSRHGRYTEAVAGLVELAETLGARVMHDPYRVNIPGNHLLQRGYVGNHPTPADTDCILNLDVWAPWMPGQFNPGPEVKIIEIGIDPVHRMTAIYEFPANLAITADTTKAIPALLEELRSIMTSEQKRQCEDRLQRYLEEGRQRLRAAVDAAEADRAKGIISSAWLSQQIGQTLDQDAIISHELCDSSLFNRSEPGTLIGTGGSAIGWAGPAAVGAKVAAPDRIVVSAVGDGSWMFANPQVTVWASAFHKAPVLFIIYNNRGYRTGTFEVQRGYPEGYAVKAGDYTGGWFDPCPNYSGEAAASGAYGEKVTDPNEVSAAIRRGLDAVREGRPAVLDMWLPKLVTGEV
ncbi:MAG TPA: thiamine pyrophosphate-requiring protein [Chloroflexota bacterium]|nr:thiamine pyrophosphate-requiring protein [Chloroflexota bacterium]